MCLGEEDPFPVFTPRGLEPSDDSWPIQEYVGPTSRQEGLVMLLSGGQSLGSCQPALLNCVPMYNVKEDSYKRGFNFTCLYFIFWLMLGLNPEPYTCQSNTLPLAASLTQIFVNCLQLLL